MVLTNCSGKLIPEATIWVFGSDYGRPGTGYLSLSSVANNIDLDITKWDYVSHDVSNIVDYMQSHGWICTVDCDGCNAPVINCDHIETRAALNKIDADLDIEYSDCDNGYIRFGAPPESGKSINHMDNVNECGVSVFRAQFAKSGNYRIIGNQVEIASYYNVCDRQAYRVWGDVVGIGSDGEPCLKISKKKKI